MPCFHPLQAWYGTELTAKGKRKLVFKVRSAAKLPNVYRYFPFLNPKLEPDAKVPCGRCIGCRLEKARQWAMRAVLESHLYDHCYSLTLTYDDANLARYCPDGGLHHEEFQKFMKRYRKMFGSEIRYFMCGEYGDRHGRPHFHAIIFNHKLPDLRFHKMSGAYPLYTSKALSRIWNRGYCAVGNMSFESAGYIARYHTKVHKGQHEKMIGGFCDIKTGEFHKKRQEYSQASRRPGLGGDWFKQFKSDCYPKDFVTVRGIKMKPPKYFDYLYEKVDETALALVKERRRKHVNNQSFIDDNTPERLAQREYVKYKEYERMVRNIDNDL